MHGKLHSPFDNTWCALFHQTVDDLVNGWDGKSKSKLFWTKKHLMWIFLGSYPFYFTKSTKCLTLFSTLTLFSYEIRVGWVIYQSTVINPLWDKVTLSLINECYPKMYLDWTSISGIAIWIPYYYYLLFLSYFKHLNIQNMQYQ